jgi:hypothetical protein
MGRNSLEVITARRTKPRSADDWRIFSQLGRPGEIPVYWMEYCQLRRFRLVDNSINSLVYLTPDRIDSGHCEYNNIGLVSSLTTLSEGSRIVRSHARRSGPVHHYYFWYLSLHCRPCLPSIVTTAQRWCSRLLIRHCPNKHDPDEALHFFIFR